MVSMCLAGILLQNIKQNITFDMLKETPSAGCKNVGHFSTSLRDKQLLKLKPTVRPFA